MFTSVFGHQKILGGSGGRKYNRKLKSAEEGKFTRQGPAKTRNFLPAGGGGEDSESKHFPQVNLPAISRRKLKLEISTSLCYSTQENINKQIILSVKGNLAFSKLPTRWCRELLSDVNLPREESNDVMYVSLKARGKEKEPSQNAVVSFPSWHVYKTGFFLLCQNQQQKCSVLLSVQRNSSKPISNDAGKCPKILSVSTCVAVLMLSFPTNDLTDLHLPTLLAPKRKHLFTMGKISLTRESNRKGFN